MSYLILKFKIPEEEEEAKTAMNGHRYKTALEELDNLMRNHSKYDPTDDFKNHTGSETEYWRMKLLEAMREVE